MAFPPYQSGPDPKGQTCTTIDTRNSLMHQAWGGLFSPHMALLGGSTLYASSIGHAHYNYDDAEGYFTRFNYHHTVSPKPFNGIGGGGTGTLIQKKYYSSGLANLRRKNEQYETTPGGSTINTNGYVTEIRNGRNAGYEVYTTGYHNEPAGDITMAKAQPGTVWHLTWYARKSNSSPTNGMTVKAAMLIFSLGYDSSTSKYTILHQGYGDGGDTGASTVTSPATGGSYYTKQVTLTTTWTKYEMTVQFPNKATCPDIVALSCRMDVDDGGGSGTPTKTYWDRPTLHPVNVNLGNVLHLIGGGTYSDVSLGSMPGGTYNAV